MREGGLDAPIRHPIDWRNPDFTDADKIEAELRRVFDICHGCRRCFNLCDSFPTLFDLIDDSETGQLDSVDGAAFTKLVDACTLCDMCFMVQCPYVPPPEFALDFPPPILPARAADPTRLSPAAMAPVLSRAPPALPLRPSSPPKLFLPLPLPQRSTRASYPRPVTAPRNRSPRSVAVASS